MYELKTIDPCKDPRWDEFVASHPYGWIVHLSGWKEVIEETFPHMKGHYLALVDSKTNTIEAGLPIYEVRSWLTGNRLVSIPFATLSDPLAVNEIQLQKLLGTIESHAMAKKNHPLILRLFQTKDLFANRKANLSEMYLTHEMALQPNPETVQKTFSRNVRRIINTFDNGPLTIKQASPDDLGSIGIFFDLYTKTRKRLGLPAQPFSMFRALFRLFAPEGHISLLTALHKEKPVGGLIVLKFKDRVSSEFLASDYALRDLNIDHFLYWNAIRSACQEGYAKYDFGRTAVSNSPLAEFKRRWGTREILLPEYSSPQNTPKEDTSSYKMIRTICTKVPTPLFQTFSRFCYRHLG